MTTATLIPTTPAEEATRRRLIEFASDALQLANERRDIELRSLVDDVYRDLLALRGEKRTDDR